MCQIRLKTTAFYQYTPALLISHAMLRCLNCLEKHVNGNLKKEELAVRWKEEGSAEAKFHFWAWAVTRGLLTLLFYQLHMVFLLWKTVKVCCCCCLRKDDSWYNLKKKNEKTCEKHFWWKSETFEANYIGNKLMFWGFLKQSL